MRLAYLKRARSLDVVDALCIVLLSLGLAAWGSGIFHRSFDYDELEHTYAIWLISNGSRPFYDFFECHPPFLWYPLSLFFRIFGDSYAVLFVFRLVTAVGHLLFFAALAKNLSASFERLPSPSAIRFRSFALAVAVIATNPLILEYLLEFRNDAWPNALLLFSIYRYRTRQSRVLRSSVEFGALSAAAIACSPKLAVFMALFMIASAVLADKRALRLGAMVAGVALGLTVVILILLALRLNPLDVYHLSITYHDLLNHNGGFGHGLAASVWGQRVPLAIVVAGVASWIVLVRSRVLSSSYEISLLGFLALQLALVSFPYKQYYGPWFLLGITFVAYLELALRRIKPLYPAVIALAMIYAGMNGISGYRSFEWRGDANAEIDFRKWLEEMAPPQGYVVASMEVMPLFRHSPFYHLVTSTALSGFDSDRIMQTMNRQPFSNRFTGESYARELELKQPDLIIPSGSLTALQKKALAEFVERHRNNYRQLDSARGPVLVRQR